MKVTKNYLRRLIEQELRNIHEGGDPLADETGSLGGLGGEVPSSTSDAPEGLGEPETAEAMLEKVHADLERWLSSQGGDVSPSPTGPAEKEVDLA